MKIFILLSIFIHLNISSSGQDPFIFSIEQPELDYISDVIQVEDKFYFIQNRHFNIQFPFESDSYSDVLVVSNDGLLIDQYNLNGFQTKYQRILKVEADELYLIGILKTDSCKSRIVISKFNLTTHALHHLSTYDYCDAFVFNIMIVHGLQQKTFIEEYHSVGTGFSKHKSIFEMDSTYQLTPVLDSLNWGSRFSVDFSRTGYVIADIGLYNFYNDEFNFRKQRYTGEFHGFVQSITITPFNHHLILEQTFQDDFSEPDKGFQVRLVDSNIIIKKKTIMMPPLPYYGIQSFPFFGGVDIQDKNEIWTVGISHFNPPAYDNSFYFIAKLDSNLNIICQQFLGYDSNYFLYGVSALESGGAIVFGSRVREGLFVNGGEDIYAIRVGENCELPEIVSTDNPKKPFLSISVYPNPGINDLTFDVNGFDAATLRVELINELGNILFTTKDLSNSIHVPELPAGQYFYRILKDDKLLGAGPWVKQ